MDTTHPVQDGLQLTGTRWRLDPAGSSAEFSAPYLWGLGSTGTCDRPPSSTRRSTPTCASAPAA